MSVYLFMTGHTAGTVTVDHRMLHANRMDGRGGRDVGKRHFDRILDRMQQLDHHVGDIAEGKFATLVGSRTARSSRLADGAPHLKRVKQERLHVEWRVVVVSKRERAGTQ